MFVADLDEAGRPAVRQRHVPRPDAPLERRARGRGDLRNLARARGAVPGVERGLRAVARVGRELVGRRKEIGEGSPFLSDSRRARRGGSRATRRRFGRGRDRVSSRTDPSFSIVRIEATFSVSQWQKRRCRQERVEREIHTAGPASVASPLRQCRDSRYAPSSACSCSTFEIAGAQIHSKPVSRSSIASAYVTRGDA